QVSTTYTVNLPGPGPYTVKAKYGGDPSYYGNSEASTTFSVTPATGTLSYSGDTVSYGGAFNVNGSLSVTQGTIPAGVMQMKFDFMQGATLAHTVTVNINGSGVAAGTTNLPHGVYQLNISLVANGYYTATSISRNLMASTTLTVGNVTGRVTETVNLTATLKAGATNLDGQTVYFTVDGTPVGQATTVGGVATLPWQVNKAVRVAPYTIGASFNTNSPYYQSTGSGNLTVIKSTPAISVSAPTVAYSDYWSTITATVTSFNGTLLSGIPVTFWINTGSGATQVGGTLNTDGTGKATLNWNQRNTWAADSAVPTVEVRFAGNTDYNLATSGVVILPKAQETGSFFNVNGVNPGNSNNYKVNFSWQDEVDAARGNPSAGTITVELYAEEPVGSWTICSTGTYTPSATPTALVNNQQVTCNVGVKLAGRRARLVVSGSTHYTSDEWTGYFADADGPMSVPSMTTMSGGTTTLSASFATGVAVKAIASPVLLAARTSDLATPMATLQTSLLAATGGSGKSSKPSVPPGLEGQPIHFSINDQFVGTALIGPDGVAHLNYRADLPAGSYTIRAEFKGNTAHGPASGTGTLTVTARGATLTFTGAPTAVPGPLNLQALVTDPLGGYDITRAGGVRYTVTDKVTGTLMGTYEASIAADGTAGLATEALPAGTYEVTMTLTDNRYYAAPAAVAQVTVEDAAQPAEEPAPDEGPEATEEAPPAESPAQ
ncbi:MAG: conserved repeat domain protein, partial [Symbiobacteriaceae bacterium]|nr:conserved repeat domain protein [Symbiobacteriaceae bacterium]